MKIPLIRPDLPALGDIAGEFGQILTTGHITNNGPYVRAFERETAAYLGTPTAAVSSGSAALLFTLQALGLPRGGRVIVPSFTFVATVQAILYAGGLPCFVDIADDMNLAVDDLEQLLAAHADVVGIVGTHVFGVPCPVDAIADAVGRYERRTGRDLFVVYDAAHGFGSSVGDRRVGRFGTAEVFSLSATKLLVAVEGGLVASADETVIDRITRMRNYGIQESYDAWWPGLNGKMSEFHAAIGLYNLRRLDRLLAARQERARYFIEAIRARTSFAAPPWRDDITQTFKDFTVLVPESLAESRGAVMEHLASAGVETRAYFSPPAHEQRLFQPFSDRKLPVTSRVAQRVISLPFFSTITPAEMDYVVTALQDAERKLS
jgi:dTDP-4-amino-4,6-dideoxygalactose transaminase